MSRSRTYGGAGDSMPPSGKYMLLYERGIRKNFWISRDFGETFHQSTIQLEILDACISQRGDFFILEKVIGSRANLYVSTDFGETFYKKEGENLSAIAVTSDSSILYGLSTYSSNVILMRSTNMGDVWSTLDSRMFGKYDNKIKTSHNGKIIALCERDTDMSNIWVYDNFGSRVLFMENGNNIDLSRDGYCLTITNKGSHLYRRLQDGSSKTFMMTNGTVFHQSIGNNKRSYLGDGNKLNIINVDKGTKTSVNKYCRNILGTNAEGTIGVWQGSDLYLTELPSGNVIKVIPLRLSVYSSEACISK